MPQAVLNQTELPRQAGYSRFTVSKALAGHPSVPDQTRDRILRVARDLGYRPNAAAKAMKSGRFNNAALIYYAPTTERQMFVFPPLLNGLNGELSRNDMHLTFSMFTDRHMAKGADGIKVLRELMVDGLLVNYDSKYSRSLRKPIDRLNVPAVWVNDKLDHDCSRPDDLQAGRWAAQRLLSLGHRRIALWHRPIDERSHYSSQDRIDGYRAAMADAGATARMFEHTSDSNPHRQADAARMLSGDDRPTAVITLGYDDAMALLLAASQLGLRVPDNLSIITIDTRHSYQHVPIETVRIPFGATGESAVRLLLEKIAHPGRRFDPVVVPYTHLDEGPTVGPWHG